MKFSNNYDKIPESVYQGAPSYLIGVQSSRFGDLPPDYVNYDSIYRVPYVGLDPNESVDAEEVLFYDFAAYGIRPDTVVLVLFLFTPGPTGGTVWTTIRRATEGKERYYRDQINKYVKIEILKGEE